MLIEEIKKALPNINLMILETFVLEGTATADKIDEFRTGVSEKAKAAKAIAEKYNLTFIPLQDKFDAALSSAPAEYRLSAGVHPTAFGHELIKN